MRKMKIITHTRGPCDFEGDALRKERFSYVKGKAKTDVNIKNKVLIADDI